MVLGIKRMHWGIWVGLGLVLTCLALFAWSIYSQIDAGATPGLHNGPVNEIIKK